MSGTERHRWWKEAVVYQIYPSSFLDTTGSGWGDIKGITAKLDYLKDLGVDIIWTSPIYKSPQADMGYDIADYKAIDPIYGTLDDVDQLIAELRKRDMKLMMDLVVNHTSDQHAWFLESRSSRNNPKRDWYIWKPPKCFDHDHPQPPNNWSQILGDADSAWTFDDKTGEYFLSLFTPQQPDLNWENPDVRAAVHDVMHFWLKRGASGFRMDVINVISKVQSFPDAEVVVPDQKWQPGMKYFANGPRLHEFLKDMNREVLSKYDSITVGEMPWVRDEDEILKVVGSTEKELNMIFIFDIVDIDCVPGQARFSLRDWKLSEMKEALGHWQRVMIERDGWNAIFMENHDNPRAVSRYVDDSDEFRDRGAKLLALMHSTLNGTLYIYQGQELGLRNAPATWGPEEFKDIESINLRKKYNARYPHNLEKLAEARYLLHRKARDHARLPMPWTSGPNAGFTNPDATPWMRINDDYKTYNVATQLPLNPDQTSHEGSAKQLTTLQYWARALRSRKAHADVFTYGDFTDLDPAHEQIFGYLRTGAEGGSWLVILNFSGEEVEWRLPERVRVKDWVAGTCCVGKPEKTLAGTVRMGKWEGVLGRCDVDETTTT
ncbi:MAG: hypothetical protein M1817_006883 [Caeruleum heppii]|nr:MAG: hypothetical protein M1817_006883 [Caeruleum heppii]